MIYMNNRVQGPTRRLQRTLELASEAGSIYMDLRDKPTRLDWIALATRVAGLVQQIAQECRRERAKCPWDYLSDEWSDGTWKVIPQELRRLVMSHVGDVQVVPEYWDGDQDSAMLVSGKIGREPLLWIQYGNDPPHKGPYLRVDREDATYAELREVLWKNLGTSRCIYSRGQLRADSNEVLPLIASRQVVQMQQRIQSFLDAGYTRSCLLVGPPGTGKSTAIRLLAQALAPRSLRVDVANLTDGDANANLNEGLSTLVQVLRPDAVILDDLDRVAGGARLLDFLEQAKKSSRLVLASANSLDAIIEAAKRPGRFDEIITYDQLDPDLLHSLAQGDADLQAAIADLPLAYATELATRWRVLGRQSAMQEVQALRIRAQKNSE